MKKNLYTADASAVGGRSGHVRSATGIIDLDMSVPEGLGGKKNATNPEELFAAGYASCFQQALLVIAQKAGDRLDPETTVQCSVTLFQEGEGYGLSAVLDVNFPAWNTIARFLLLKYTTSIHAMTMILDEGRPILSRPFLVWKLLIQKGFGDPGRLQTVRRLPTHLHTKSVRPNVPQGCAYEFVPAALPLVLPTLHVPGRLPRQQLLQPIHTLLLLPAI